MNKSTFHITRMDCAAEEQLIRMKLEGDTAIRALSFNIPQRELVVFHDHSPQTVAQKVNGLNLGSTLLESVEVETSGNVDTTTQRNVLWSVLAINFGCFVIELGAGFISRSMGLVADSLDMLADAFVYGLALLAVGGTALGKKRIATLAGCFQMVLAIVGFAEVLRRFMGYDVAPDFGTMILISIIALAGNAICLLLLQRSKSTEPHMKASLIFTSNDVIINIGVIAAGVLVYFTGSNKPDLIIGSIVFFIVLRGALRILKLGN
jgi:Co/Zn/Cd efflux system component